MGLIKTLLQEPIIWNISQTIFGANLQKQKLYRSLIKKKGKLLDFGCADGNTFSSFRDFDYTGVDIDYKAIAYASKRYSSDYPNAKYICANVLDNKLPKESFDIILFAGTGHHLPNSLLFKITKSLSRLLKKGGTLYLIDSIKDDSRKSKLLSFLMLLDQGKFYKNEKFYNQSLSKFSKDLKPLFQRKYIITNAFMPQPTYYIAQFSKI